MVFAVIVIFSASSYCFVPFAVSAQPANLYPVFSKAFGFRVSGSPAPKLCGSISPVALSAFFSKLTYTISRAHLAYKVMLFLREISWLSS